MIEEKGGFIFVTKLSCYKSISLRRIADNKSS